MLMILLVFVPSCPGILRCGDGFFMLHVDMLIEVLDIRERSDKKCTPMQTRARRRFMDILKHLVDAKLLISYYRGDETGYDESRFVTVEARPIVDGFGNHRLSCNDHEVMQEEALKNFFKEGLTDVGKQRLQEKFKARQEEFLRKSCPIGALTGFEFPDNFAGADNLQRFYQRNGKLPTSTDERAVHKRVRDASTRKRRTNRKYMREWRAEHRRLGGERKEIEGGTTAVTEPTRFRIILPANTRDELGEG